MKIRIMLSVVAALWLSVVLAACGSDSSNSVPIATDYSKAAHWLSLPATVKNVDIFYLYPTAWHKVNPTDPNINEIDNASMIAGANSAFAKSGTVFETVGNIGPKQKLLQPKSRVLAHTCRLEDCLRRLPTMPMPELTLPKGC